MTPLVSIGVDSYSYHRFFGEVRAGEARASETWTCADLLDRVPRPSVEVLGLETCHLAGTSLDDIQQVADVCTRRHRDLVLTWGHPEGVAMGHRREGWRELDRLLDVAAACGIRLAQIVLGGPRQYRAEPEATMVRRLAGPLQHLVDRGLRDDIRIAVETHCGLTLEALSMLLDEVPGLGVVLDTGNVVRIGDDLLVAATALGDHVRMVHAKDLALDQVVANVGPGHRWWTTPVGAGDLGIDGALERLFLRGFSGPVCIELMELAAGWEGREHRAIERSLEYLHRLRRQFDERLLATN